jgi:hypothetical protein
MIKVFGNTRYLLIISAFGMVAFVSSCAALTPSTKGMGIAFTIMGPFFVGFIELAALALAPLFCKPEEIGVSSGMLASIRAAGNSAPLKRGVSANLRRWFHRSGRVYHSSHK